MCIRDRNYPAVSFFDFFENHKLMHKERPKWRTVKGGSKNYVDKFVTELGERIRSGNSVSSVAPSNEQVDLHFEDGELERYDEVILACHSDQSARLLSSGFEEKHSALGEVRYRPNMIYVHRDPALMPTRKAAWASWNVLKQVGEDICCLLYTSPSPRDATLSRMPSSA